MEYERLRAENATLVSKISELHIECRKYRVALNRIAYPESWGSDPDDYKGIATRALVIGGPPPALPPDSHPVREKKGECKSCIVPRPGPSFTPMPEPEHGPWKRSQSPNKPSE